MLVKDQTVTLWDRMKEEFVTADTNISYSTSPGSWHDFTAPRVNREWYHFFCQDPKLMSIQGGEPWKCNINKAWYLENQTQIDNIITTFEQDSGYTVHLTLTGKYD